MEEGEVTMVQWAATKPTNLVPLTLRHKLCTGGILQSLDSKSATVKAASSHCFGNKRN